MYFCHMNFVSAGMHTFVVQRICTIGTHTHTDTKLCFVKEIPQSTFLFSWTKLFGFCIKTIAYFIHAKNTALFLLAVNMSCAFFIKMLTLIIFPFLLSCQMCQNKQYSVQVQFDCFYLHFGVVRERNAHTSGKIFLVRFSILFAVQHMILLLTERDNCMGCHLWRFIRICIS